MKRMYGIVAVVVVVIIAAVVAVVVHNHSSVGQVSDAQAKAATSTTAACAKADTKLVITDKDRNDIEQTAISHIIDVPAGTNVDANINTYGQDKTTGSLIYPGKYGTYNFTLVKNQASSANQLAWKITEFTKCKQ